MAKVKLKKFPKRWYFRLLIERKEEREEEDVKLFHKKCDDFYSFLKEKLPFKEHSFVLGKQLVDEDNYSFNVHFWPKQEAKVKAVILEGAEKHKIEFEEKEKKKKEEKWIPAHKTIVELLKKNSNRYTEPYAALYARETKAPKQGILDLLKHFEAVLPHSGGYLHEILEQAIQNLKEQQKEG